MNDFPLMWTDLNKPWLRHAAPPLLASYQKPNKTGATPMSLVPGILSKGRTDILLHLEHEHSIMNRQHDAMGVLGKLAKRPSAYRFRQVCAM